MIDRRAQAEWKGDLKNGTGHVRAGKLESSYSFASRFEDGPGTTPEALIGAAHAGCFSMALSLILDEHGYTPEEIKTTATVSLDPGGLEITCITLETRASVAGLDDPAEFERIATEAKQNCPVSRALRGTEIRLGSTELCDRAEVCSGSGPGGGPPSSGQESEDSLDDALRMTFPASDPIALARDTHHPTDARSARG